MDIIDTVPKASRIQDKRKKRGWTQDQLAQVSGVDKRTIQRIEAQKPASLSTLQALAAAFECEIEEILDQEVPKEERASSGAKGPSTADSKGKEPKVYFLRRLKSGKAIFDVTASAHLFQSDYDEPRSSEEADALAEFIQVIQDTSELWGDLEPGDHVKYAFQCNDWLKKIEDLGFAVFGIRRRVVWVSQMDPSQRTPMEMATLVLKRTGDPRIVVTPEGLEVLPALIPSGPTG